MKEINKDSLKVGDTVYVAKRYELDWEVYFRYPFYRKETITKITPKRTKFVTNMGQYDKCVAFYEYSEEMERQHRITSIAKKVDFILPQLGKISSSSLKDEQLEALLPLLEQMVEVIITSIAKKVDFLLPQLGKISSSSLKDEQLEALLPLLEQVAEVIGKKK